MSIQATANNKIQNTTNLWKYKHIQKIAKIALVVTALVANIFATFSIYNIYNASLIGIKINLASSFLPIAAAFLITTICFKVFKTQKSQIIHSINNLKKLMIYYAKHEGMPYFSKYDYSKKIKDQIYELQDLFEKQLTKKEDIKKWIKEANLDENELLPRRGLIKKGDPEITIKELIYNEILNPIEDKYFKLIKKEYKDLLQQYYESVVDIADLKDKLDEICKSKEFKNYPIFYQNLLKNKDDEILDKVIKLFINRNLKLSFSHKSILEEILKIKYLKEYRQLICNIEHFEFSKYLYYFNEDIENIEQRLKGLDIKIKKINEKLKDKTLIDDEKKYYVGKITELNLSKSRLTAYKNSFKKMSEFLVNIFEKETRDDMIYSLVFKIQAENKSEIFAILNDLNDQNIAVKDIKAAEKRKKGWLW